MSDSIKLRTLTLKSIVPVGNLGITVQRQFEINKQFLIWIYYRYEWISFTQDVIDLLGIEPIIKPGCNIELAKQARFDCFHISFISTHSIKKTHNYHNKDKKLYSPKALQRKNHGKF